MENQIIYCDIEDIDVKGKRKSRNVRKWIFRDFLCTGIQVREGA